MLMWGLGVKLTMTTKHFNIILEEKVPYRLHRKSQNEYNKISRWTAEIIFISQAIGHIPRRTSFLGVTLMKTTCRLSF
jgi:hypothetical protein